MSGELKKEKKWGNSKHDKRVAINLFYNLINEKTTLISEKDIWANWQDQKSEKKLVTI